MYVMSTGVSNAINVMNHELCYKKQIITAHYNDDLTHCGWDKMAVIFQPTFFKCIFFNENVWISVQILLKFVPKVPINNISALVQIMAWPQSGDKQSSEPMMVCLLMHICITWPQTWDDQNNFQNISVDSILYTSFKSLCFSLLVWFSRLIRKFTSWPLVFTILSIEADKVHHKVWPLTLLSLG